MTPEVPDRATLNDPPGMSQTQRLLLAIVAWPAGILAAVLLVLVRSFFDDPCVAGQICAKELEPVSFTKLGIWLAVAFGPGALATRAWWRARSQRDEDQ